MAKLKVFRTAAGFDDAYVAAPSRKAALKAWGADKDLFAQGVAEEVTDPALREAPLATPGAVVKVSRGDRAAQLAALPERTPKAAKPGKVAKVTHGEPMPKPKPRPSRADLDAAEEAAEEALTKAEARHETEHAALAKEEAELDRRKRDMARTQAVEVARLGRTREAADTEYREALADWRRTQK